MENVKLLIVESALPEEQYYQEAFGVARVTDGNDKKIKTSLDGVVVEGSSKRTLLEQAEAPGLSSSNNCTSGLCATYKVTM